MQTYMSLQTALSECETTKMPQIKKKTGGRGEVLNSNSKAGRAWVGIY
jgi:hypothetical protein